MQPPHPLLRQRPQRKIKTHRTLKNPPAPTSPQPSSVFPKNNQRLLQWQKNAMKLHGHTTRAYITLTNQPLSLSLLLARRLAGCLARPYHNKGPHKPLPACSSSCSSYPHTHSHWLSTTIALPLYAPYCIYPAHLCQRLSNTGYATVSLILSKEKDDHLGCHCHCTAPHSFPFSFPPANPFPTLSQ